MGLPIWCISVGFFHGENPIYGFVYSPGSSMFFYCDNTNSYLNENRVVIDKSLAVEKETNLLYSSEIAKPVDIIIYKELGTFLAVLEGDSDRSVKTIRRLP